MSFASPHADGDRYAAQRHMGETRQHYGLTLATLTMAATAYALQQTMVVPALPELQRELGASTTWVTWVMTGFLLAAAVLTPILGKLGDRYGKERLLVLSLWRSSSGASAARRRPTSGR